MKTKLEELTGDAGMLNGCVGSWGGRGQLAW